MESPPGGEATEPSGLSSCPSFNSYSCNHLLARLHLHDHLLVKEYDCDDHDFEFAPVSGDVCDPGFAISPYQIVPGFPAFDRDLLLENGYGVDVCDSLGGGGGGGGGDLRSIRIPLKDLFMEEDRDSQSTEADEELEGIPEGSYCMWAARESGQSSPSWCKKSNSTGSRSSGRWRFLDLLRRSNSDRRESFVFLKPSLEAAKLAKEERNSRGGGKSKTTGAAAEGEQRKATSSGSRLEVFYTRNKVAVKGGGGGSRRKSYLPYRQDLVGFLANVNSLGRTFPPFG
ncbi:hypothetical protein MLD38_000409 [Melastoma candidum]|uniref:Uncharacterized protein n=1 Tax=Melastoma candidum TaxID=119954 RepID=A0ACB9S9S1_9MYRT|nr:hypothetical protein MLD38_000409 [Melastoma candidum]